MTNIDPAKLVAALRKAMEKVDTLTERVEFLEEQNGKRARMEDELARQLTSLRTQVQQRADGFEATVCAGLQDLLDTQLANTNRLQGQGRHLLQLEAFVIGHEAALIGLTGRETELVLPDHNPDEVTASEGSGALMHRLPSDPEVEVAPQPKAA
ncbi:hypothetical protein ASG52_00010 [Methylobacterium sp. Leaf456]|uniref:hypothetical protein n=1 Tax=Methylobacterium sp. Leaf456 TaxID=1736382 RepID=UPI0006F4281A|nr:hypothetical protein [Methylobacterium sp. Leaf456]KQT61317.1 hypothetical protein ASG52_00010 [Methylobacterium sp. Leaf456]